MKKSKRIRFQQADHIHDFIGLELIRPVVMALADLEVEMLPRSLRDGFLSRLEMLEEEFESGMPNASDDSPSSDILRMASIRKVCGHISAIMDYLSQWLMNEFREMANAEKS